MNRIRSRRRLAGFSLLELMLTLTVLGILVSIAIPSFSYLAANTKMKGASTNLHLALLKARSEAVKRSSTVTITPTTGTNWAGGWTMTAGATVLSVQAPMQGISITPTPSPLASLVFLSSGRVQNNSPSFVLLPVARNRTETSETPIKRCISLQANGSPYVREAPCT